MRILLLSAYDAASHKSWREGLVALFPEHDWQVFTMPPRYFAWRIRGNGLHWAYKILPHESSFDLIVATSMVDLATLKGLSPLCSSTPTLLYFHENQLVYPVSRDAKSSLEPAMVNIYSALSADLICFNSEYNRLSFLEGSARLLGKFPDYVPSNLQGLLKGKSRCVPVGLEASLFSQDVFTKKLGTLVWNHRWEYDKSPERLLALVKHLPSELDLCIHVIGQSFNRTPECMLELKDVLEKRAWLGKWGPIESRQEYIACLRESQIVLSTAIHDFQGLSVLEATACGCMPVVPDRLAYRDFIPSVFRYRSNLDDAGIIEAKCAAELVVSLLRAPKPAPDISHLAWSRLRDEYASLFVELSSLQAPTQSV